MCLAGVRVQALSQRRSYQSMQIHPPFRKGGREISAEYPEASDAGCVACCEILAAQEYAPAGVSVSTDYVCRNPHLAGRLNLFFTKGGAASRSRLGQRRKLKQFVLLQESLEHQGTLCRAQRYLD